MSDSLIALPSHELARLRAEIRAEVVQEILTYLRHMAPSVPPKAYQENVPGEGHHMEWNIPDDGMVHYWTFQGKTYVANADRCVWSITEEGQPGAWVGEVDLYRGIIDTSVPEPEYE